MLINGAPSNINIISRLSFLKIILVFFIKAEARWLSGGLFLKIPIAFIKIKRVEQTQVRVNSSSQRVVCTKRVLALPSVTRRHYRCVY